MGYWRGLGLGLGLPLGGAIAKIADVLDKLPSIDLPATELSEAFLREAGQSGFQVVIDCVWGGPAEALLAAITRREFAAIQSETRFVPLFRLGRALLRPSLFQQPCCVVRH